MKKEKEIQNKKDTLKILVYFFYLIKNTQMFSKIITRQEFYLNDCITEIKIPKFIKLDDFIKLIRFAYFWPLWP